MLTSCHVCLFICRKRPALNPEVPAQCLESSSFAIDSFGVATPQDYALANITGPYTWFNQTQYEVQAPKCASKSPQCVSPPGRTGC